MRVLFLSPDFVLPAERGLRVRALSQLRVLSAIEAVESITFLSLTDVPVPVERQRALEAELPKVKVLAPIVHVSSIRRHPRALVRVLRRRFLYREPYVVAKSDDPPMRALVRRTLKSATYDVVYLGYIGMMPYLGEVRRLAGGAGVVLEQHNVEWQIFDRIADAARSPMREAIRWEARTLRRFERDSLRQVDSVIAISGADAAGLRALAGVDAVVVPPFIAAGRPRTETGRGSALGYIGHLGWQPNVYGLDWFCAKIWPLVRERIPDATLTIAGPGLRKGPDGALVVPPAWITPGITVVGFVDDLEDIYRKTVGMVAPVVGGSGVRMKLLETMSAGMPTVTTTDGAAGLGVTHGTEVLVADDPTAFADAVVRVLGDAALREHLRRGGYAFLAENHSMASARKRVEQSLKDAIARRA